MRKAIIVGLTVVIASGLSLAALATTTTHTFFGVTNPDITIEVLKHRVSSTSGYWEDATARFTLSGTGAVSGWMDTSTDAYTVPWVTGGNSTSNPNLYGTFSGTGDLQSEFLANTYCWKGYRADSYVTYNQLDVTGATVLSVIGDAFAVCADSATSNAAGQFITNGDSGFACATSAYVEAGRQVINHTTNTWTGAYMDATASGTLEDPVCFGGYTEGRYYNATHHFGLAVPEMGSGGVSPPLAEGFGFDVAISGSSLTGNFTSSYAYQHSITTPLEFRGEAGTWMPTWGPWSGWNTYPGNYPIYGDPIP